MLADVCRDVRAPTKQAPAEARWATWTKYHVKWVGSAVPVLPITPQRIEAVAAEMKRAKYRLIETTSRRRRGTACPTRSARMPFGRSSTRSPVRA